MQPNGLFFVEIKPASNKKQDQDTKTMSKPPCKAITQSQSTTSITSRIIQPRTCKAASSSHMRPTSSQKITPTKITPTKITPTYNPHLKPILIVHQTIIKLYNPRKSKIIWQSHIPVLIIQFLLNFDDDNVVQHRQVFHNIKEADVFIDCPAEKIDAKIFRYFYFHQYKFNLFNTYDDYIDVPSGIIDAQNLHNSFTLSIHTFYNYFSSYLFTYVKNQKFYNYKYVKYLKILFKFTTNTTITNILLIIYRTIISNLEQIHCLVSYFSSLTY
jgi:hypothetical protein